LSPGTPTGERIHIARNDWRNRVFLPGLAQKWNNAAELYDAILSGLNDGFAADLILLPRVWWRLTTIPNAAIPFRALC
jgi:hypothetical protein